MLKLLKIFFPDQYFKGSLLLSLLFGFGYVAGDIFVYQTQNTFNLMAIISGFFLSMLYLIFFILLTKVDNALTNEGTSLRILAPIKSHPFRNVFIILIIAWLPHLLIKYPAGQCPDSYTQIQMGLHPKTLTTHHPLVSTLIMSGFVRLGMLIENINIGMFIYVMLEALILALIFSYMFTVLQKKIYVSDPVLLGGICFFSFSPYIIGYVGQAIKDVMYTAGFILLLSILTEYLTTDKDRSKLFKKTGMILKLLCSSSMLFFYRKEGILILIISFLLIVFHEIKKYKKMTTFIPVLITVLLIPILINFTLEQKYNPKKGSIREMLSLPFQQTARYVIKRQDIISYEEIEAISRILDIESIPDRYISWNSDQIKDLYNENADKDDLKNYFKAWLTGFRKAPLCYLRATLEQNIYLIYPGYNNYIYYTDANSGVAYLFSSQGLFSAPDHLVALQSEYEAFLGDLHTFPVFNVINNMSFYLWLLLACTIIALNKRSELFLHICIPLYFSILVIIFGPCIRGSIRYAFPVIWSFPLWAGCLMSHRSFNDSINDKEI